jgi:hypothetical protein
VRPIFLGAQTQRDLAAPTQSLRQLDHDLEAEVHPATLDGAEVLVGRCVLDVRSMIVAAIAEREKRMRKLQVRIEALRTSPTVIGSELSELEKEARHRLDNLREILGRNPEEARKAVGALLNGPLSFTPVQTEAGKRYEIQGSIATGALFISDSVPNGKLMVVNPGYVPGIARALVRELNLPLSFKLVA